MRYTHHTSETDIQAACLEFLAARRVFAWRNNTTGVYDPQKGIFRRFSGMKGVADILAVLPGGRMLAVEVKTPTGKVSANQEDFLSRVDENGGAAMVVRSVDELEQFLNEFLAENQD